MVTTPPEETGCGLDGPGGVATLKQNEIECDRWGTSHSCNGTAGMANIETWPENRGDEVVQTGTLTTCLHLVSDGRRGDPAQ